VCVCAVVYECFYAQANVRIKFTAVPFEFVSCFDPKWVHLGGLCVRVCIIYTYV
jgi:hypothetical protein